MSAPRLPAESSDAHLDRPTWANPGDWGARHISDIAPFTLWDPITRQYRMPKNPEYEWCKEKFGDGTLMQPGWFTAISSSSPPIPAPLTLGACRLSFTPPARTRGVGGNDVPDQGAECRDTEGAGTAGCGAEGGVYALLERCGAEGQGWEGV
ncbi:hypothetical protein V501_02783 [Pseudogymnoascus sp. VKM F-4519 (FW-2642)]|nr:hypothetical protein V501_02783 [Pseudogymnoascus sp. VKM F-4519 (FW-2642)]